MEFGLSSEQQAWVSRVADFAARLPVGAPGVFPRESWNACGDFGLAGACIPESLGGMGLGALDATLLYEAFTKRHTDLGLAFSLSAHLYACALPLAHHAKTERVQEYVRQLATGRLVGANAMTEAGSGSDVYSMKASATKTDAGYVLRGEKSYVSNGPAADVMLVYAVTHPKRGYLGLSAFAVERNTPGIQVGKPFDKVGLKTAQTSTVAFDDVLIPHDALVGDEGMGGVIFNESMLWERACLFGMYLGLMDRMFDCALEQAKTRKQFGKAIGKNQAISHRLVDMKLRMDSARLLLYRACWERDRGQEAALEVSLAKLAVSEAAVSSALDAMRIYGGLGVIEDSGVSGWLRDALPGLIFSGTNEMQHEIAARALGL